MRLLLVEDEERLAATLARGLRADGYAVDSVHDGRDGLSQAMVQRYDAIILDVMLPRLSGYAVCAELRRAGDAVPILMLTAKSGEHDEAEALDIGADDFVAKPFSYVVLLARLRALLRRGGPTRPMVLRVGDLSVDPATRTCLRGGTAIRLTAKEFAVLECLARQAGQVVTKIEMIEQVWDRQFDGDVNIVEVYVRALRRKLDLPYGRRSIETVRGAGYRLVPGDA